MAVFVRLSVFITVCLRFCMSVPVCVCVCVCVLLLCVCVSVVYVLVHLSVLLQFFCCQAFSVAATSGCPCRQASSPTRQAKVFLLYITLG